MTRSLLALFLIPISLAALRAQNSCNLTVDAGADITICAGGSGNLNGVANGPSNITVEWTPATGLSNPNILNPSASPLSTTTYLLSASAMSDNLIENGGFEDGTINPATSGYTQVADPVAIATNAPNFYGILSVPQIVQAFGCQPSIGNFTMVIHGSTGAAVNFWCQTVPVTPQTDYKFTYKVFGIPYFFAPAPKIALKVNGVTIGTVTAPNGLCLEASGSFTWNSGASTSADVCFANSQVAGLGSMCALDDITMVECCVATDSVTVHVAEDVTTELSETICKGDFVEVGGQSFGEAGQYQVTLQTELGCDSIVDLEVIVAEAEAFINQSGNLNCINETAILDGSLSTGTFGVQSYAWSTSNGQFQSGTNGPSVTISAPGIYTLVVTTTNGTISCTDDVTVTVTQDTVTPQFQIVPPPQVPCQDTALTLTAQAPNLPANAGIQWTTQNGVILNGAKSLTPSVANSAATYILTITNPINGCSRVDSVTVVPSGNAPLVQTLSLPDITCRDSIVLIRMAVVKPDSGYTLLWTTVNGNILSGKTSDSLLVNKAGTYLLTVNDTLGGCSATFSATVDALLDPPALTLAALDTFGCTDDSISLNALVAPGFDSLALQWSTIDGKLQGDAKSLNAFAGGPGTYNLIAVDLRSGCRDTASIQVVPDKALPLAKAGPDLIIDCASDTVFPNTAGSSSGGGYSIQWTTGNGKLSATDVLQPGMTAAGTYVLSITDTLSLCTATDTVSVTLDKVLPSVSIAMADTLDCKTSTVLLPATVAPPGRVTLSWTGPAGGILSGDATSQATVGAPGLYVLLVTDTVNQCVALDTVTVLQDIVPPVIVLASPDTIDCSTPTVTLNASASQPAGKLSFQWTTANGSIVSGAASAQPVVNSGGTYALLVTNNQNGCTASGQLSVFKDPNLPVVTLQTPEAITCIKSQVSLNANPGTPPAGTTFQWSTPNGTLVGPTNVLGATAGSPGTYVFTMTLPGGGCTATEQVTVAADTAVPDVVVPAPKVLTCTDTSITLQAIPQNASQPTFAWTGPGGKTGTSPSLPVDQPGVWTLVWTNPANGCTRSLSGSVIQDIQPPVANAGVDQALPCGSTQGSLDGNASQGKGTLSWNWTALSGQIVSGAQTPTPLTGGAGSFVLLVTDAANGCTDRDTVALTQSGTGIYTFQVVQPPCPGTDGSITVIPGSGVNLPVTVGIQGKPGSFPAGQPIPLGSGSWTLTMTDAAGCAVDTLLTMPSGNALNLVAPAEVIVQSGGTGLIELSGIPASSIAGVSWDPVEGLSATADPLVWEVQASTDRSYTVTVTTKEGCTATASVLVRVSNVVTLFIPQAFSPNNKDGINDAFFPFNRPGTFDRIKSMAVFDRWGNALFLREDFPAGDPAYGWDGTYRGKVMDSGVYVWAIEVDLPSGGSRVYKGEVTLVE